MSDNTYNGWTNYETWQAALWLRKADFLGNSEESGLTEVDVEILEYEIYELAGAEDMTGLARDIYNSWMSCANLQEIADLFTSWLESQATVRLLRD